MSETTETVTAEAARSSHRKVREGYVADLLVLNGNPLDNLKLFNPAGVDVMLMNGKPVSNYTAQGMHDQVEAGHISGIEWTIKDGIPYHGPTLLREVKEIVARAKSGRTTTDGTR